MSSASDHLPQRIALVHEWFSPRSVGAADQVAQVVESLLRSLGCEQQMAALMTPTLYSWAVGFTDDLTHSQIQRLPWGRSRVQQYLPQLPFAVEQIDLGCC